MIETNIIEIQVFTTSTHLRVFSADVRDAPENNILQGRFGLWERYYFTSVVLGGQIAGLCPAQFVATFFRPVGNSHFGRNPAKRLFSPAQLPSIILGRRTLSKMKNIFLKVSKYKVT